MNTTPLYIFDLDDTLADLKHRRHFVEYPHVECENCLHDHNERRCQLCGTKHPFKPNWDAFHAACVDDTPIDAIIDVLAELPRPRLLVLGDMGEVGDQGVAFHREVGAYARSAGIEALQAMGNGVVNALIKTSFRNPDFRPMIRPRWVSAW